SAQAVLLDSPEPGARVHYTEDGRDPAADSPAFGTTLPVTASLGIRALAVDAAGNVSPVSAFDYTISPLRPLVIHDSATVVPRDTAGSRRVARLHVAAVLRLRKVHRRGIAVTFVTPADAAVARLLLFKGAGRRPV